MWRAIFIELCSLAVATRSAHRTTSAMLNTSKPVKPTDIGGQIRAQPACAGIFVKEASSRPYIPAHTPPTKFIIFTRGRSGSNFLATLINSHPAVECHMEALSKAAVYSHVQGWTVAERNANRSGFLDILYAGNPERRPQAVGFKVFPQQMTMSEFVGLASSPHVKKIVLRRKNLLDVFVSELKARKMGVYEYVNTSSMKVHVFLTDFRRFVQLTEKEYDCIDSARDGTWLDVDYNSLASPDLLEATLGKIFKHLGVAIEARGGRGTDEKLKQVIGHILATVSHAKQDMSLQSESIDNFVQLTRAFQGTRYASMLRRND